MAVGFSIPFWISFSQKDETVVTETKYTVYISTWYVMVCKEKESGSCATEAIQPDFGSGSSNVAFSFVGDEQSVAAKYGADNLGMCHFLIVLKLL